MNPFFMFVTGIEGSSPTIHNGRTRVDLFAKTGHYDQWQRDFDRVQELGISFLRYGPPIQRTFLGPDCFDWEFADTTFGDLLKRDIAPIVDLCHFGVPDWIGDFQNPDFPDLFAQYARAFARSLTVPIVMPSEYHEPFAIRRREWMRKHRDHKQVADAPLRT